MEVKEVTGNHIRLCIRPMYSFPLHASLCSFLCFKFYFYFMLDCSLIYQCCVSFGRITKWLRVLYRYMLWPPHAKTWLIGKDSGAGRDWGHEEKGTTEDEMAGWHHCLDGRESEWTLGVGDGQGGLACCDSWGSKDSDTTEWLNWTDWYIYTHAHTDTRTHSFSGFFPYSLSQNIE